MIDAHHHLWDLAAREHRWLMGEQPWATDDELARLRQSFTLADLVPLAAAAGVTGTVVIQTAAEPWETPDLLALAAGRDPYAAGDQACGPEPARGGPVDGSRNEPADGGGLLAGVVGWTDLTASAVADAVAGLRALPGGEFLCGIRHPVLAEADPGWLARPAVLRGLHTLAAAGLHVFDRVQPGLIQERFTIARPGALHRARRALSVLKTLSIVLPAVAITLFGLAFAISRDRRRTLLHTGIGLLAAGLVGVVLVVAGRSYYLQSVVGPDVPQPAATALYDTVVRDLRHAYKVTSLAGIALVVVALLAGPSRAAIRLRSLTVRGAGAAADHAVGEDVRSGWVAANRSTLRTVAVVVGLLFLVTAHELTWTLLLVVGGGVAIALGAIEVLARPRPD